MTTLRRSYITVHDTPQRIQAETRSTEQISIFSVQLWPQTFHISSITFTVVRQ